MAPAGDPSGILERDVEPTQVDDQAQVFDIRRAVLAVVVVPPSRTRKPARSLVESHRVGRDADLAAPIRRSSRASANLGVAPMSRRSSDLRRSPSVNEPVSAPATTVARRPNAASLSARIRSIASASAGEPPWYAQRSRRRVPPSVGWRSAVAANGPSPARRAARPTRSYGCQSTISSSVARRPVTH